MKNIIQEVNELEKSHVHIKNPDKVNQILRNLVDGGVDKLQILCDYDRTITKQHEDGKPHHTSFGLFENCPSTSQYYKEYTDQLTRKYRPLEIDPNIPKEQRIKYMEEWWDQSNIALRGEKVSPNEIQEVCRKLSPSLRDGCKEFFYSVYESKIPLLVFSAGIGDTLTAVLKQNDILLPNVKVVSNFFDYDSNGTIQGFKNKPIHVYNKNEFAIKGTDFYNLVLDRNNVIVLGDSIGDANMADGVEHASSVLKIGFLYDHIKESLPNYLDAFDIVLEDDQTMNIPNAILRCINSKK